VNAEQLRAADAAVATALWPNGAWWCPACEEPLACDEVTYDKKHDEKSGGCGSVVLPLDPVSGSNWALWGEMIEALVGVPGTDFGFGHIDLGWFAAARPGTSGPTQHFYPTHTLGLALYRAGVAAGLWPDVETKEETQ